MALGGTKHPRRPSVHIARTTADSGPRLTSYDKQRNRPNRENFERPLPTPASTHLPPTASPRPPTNRPTMPLRARCSPVDADSRPYQAQRQCRVRDRRMWQAARGERTARSCVAKNHRADSFPLRAFSNSILPNQYNAVNGASAVASHDPYTNAMSINNISRFSFASLAPNKTSPPEEKTDPLDFGDFLTPLNFDDFHTSITSTEPNLSHFPLPGRGGELAQNTFDQTSISQPAASAQTAKKISATSALGRKNSNASNGHPMGKSDSMSNTGVSIFRGRRQSHFPPNSFKGATSKAPRKSVGPGTFIPPEASENTAPQRRPSVGGRKSSAEKKEGGLSIRLLNKGGSSADSKGISSPRTMKAKSLLEPGMQSAKDFLTPSGTPDHVRSSSTNVPSTPNRLGRSGTPGRMGTPGATSTSNRRMSVMPPHAKGLGARTISPTDARRMRRMSTMPHAPPLPQNRISQAPPTPQAEMPPTLPCTTAQSPGLAPRKSITPSSSRTTPDPNRKSYSSGQSLSSSTSYGSTRNSTSIPVRFPLNPSSSRLPTPKPRLDTSNLSGEEEVPPVPAIPKAYESPHSEIEQPFFSARSSSLTTVDTPINGSAPEFSLTDAMKAIDTPRPPSNSSRKSGLLQVETEGRQKPGAAASNKGFLISRLPPLNLLPLSTPTASKIKALKQPKTPTEDQASSPPSYRNYTKTPSTPLTASKATFFSRGNRKSDEQSSAPMRSNTSHNFLGFTDDHGSPGSASPNLPPFAFEEASGNRRNISPFVSSSLPKNSGEFPSYMRPNFGAELNRTNAPTRPHGPRAPSFSVTSKPEKESPIEPEPTAVATPIRRKLSKKRSESRTHEPQVEGIEVSKYDNMPPPKLPASATWGNMTAKSSSPTHQKASFLKSRRKTSSSSVSIQLGPARQGSFGSVQSAHSDGQHIGEASAMGIQSSRSGSLLGSVQNLTAHKSNSHLRSSDSSLDRDDLIAEDEMKKLASKRKDFESAARELDGLRRRARPVEAISPVEALQTVNLNIFERGEIIDFPDIYFTGTNSAKKIVGDLNHKPSNFGYDDERGDYNIVEGDHLAYRYEVVDVLGKGSFGQVVRCVDHKTGMLVAVKIIRNKKRFHQQALVEVKILQKLREWVGPCTVSSKAKLTGTRILTRNTVSSTSIRAFTSGIICVSQLIYWG